MSRWRNRICVLLSAALLAVCPAGAGHATAAQEEALSLHARGAVLMDGDSGRILYGKEEAAPLPMASTTKLMTCIVALEEADPKLVCTASANAAAQPEVKLGMQKGDRFCLQDLLYSLMLESHNDTAVCIAETVAGSVEAFAARMNQKAAEIGCVDTHYVTPNGLDGEDAGGIHHTTAAELARVMRYCITQSARAQEFLEVTQTMNYSFTDLSGTRHYSCVNHNAFLTMMDGALTGKTGFTSQAGYCYVGALYRDGRLLIVSLLACGWPGHKSWKWSDTRALMEYGLEQFHKREVTDPSISAPPLPVLDGKQPSVALAVLQQPVELLMRADETVTSRLELAESLAAPVAKGRQAGVLRYYLNGTEFLSFPVVTAEAVEKVDFPYYLSLAAEQFLL